MHTAASSFAKIENGVLSYHQTDHLASNAVTTNSSGNVANLNTDRVFTVRRVDSTGDDNE